MTVKIGVLWDREINFESQNPLGEEGLSDTYRLFSEIAERKDGKVYLTNYQYFEDGNLEKSVFYDGEEWNKEKNVEIDSVFDKYKFDGGTKYLKKKITEDFHVINEYGLEKVCKDKLLTSQKFPDLVPRTEIATESNVESMLKQNQQLVVKPRYELGGRGVKLIDSLEKFEKKDNQLIQVFVDASEGFEDLNVDGVHDLRLMMVNGSPELAYFRLTDEGFVSNISQGGRFRFIENEEVPQKAFEVAEKVAGELEKWNPSFYSVDMLFDSEKNPQVLELNSKPALNFYSDEEIQKWKEPVVEKVVENLINS